MPDPLPRQVPTGVQSNDVAHITDMYRDRMGWRRNPWMAVHVGKMLKEFEESVDREPPVPVGAPPEYVPKRKA